MKYYFGTRPYNIILRTASTHSHGPTTLEVDGCAHTFYEATPQNDEVYDQLIKNAIEDHLKQCINCRYDEELLGGVQGR